MLYKGSCSKGFSPDVEMNQSVPRMTILFYSLVYNVYQNRKYFITELLWIALK